MQEELNQFERNNVYELVPRPKTNLEIVIKWVFHNKLGENGSALIIKIKFVAK